MKKKIRYLLSGILVLLAIGAGALLAYKNIYESTPRASNEIIDTSVNSKEEALVVPEKKVQIYSGTDRPIAVMIDNHTGAWPQANLNKAYLVYEMIAEGGETRLMALFKGQDLKKLGQ